jgi:CubicO group peptidase (beta-lactamase class C family)
MSPALFTTVRRVAAVASLSVCGGSAAAQTSPRSFVELERQLEKLREEARIPAISAAVVASGRVVWSKGFGVADLETGRRASDTTAYHLASLTKPFAATLLLQMVRDGRLSLDAPVSNFGIQIPSEGVIRVRHLLSHTSGGVPGTTYAYNGNRFGMLDSVISRVSGKSVAKLIHERIVVPLQLRHTAPNPLSPQLEQTPLKKADVERNLARGYTTTSGQPVLTTYPSYFGGSAGLTASVLDMARFSIALDDGTLLDSATRALAWTPTMSSTGATLPYGLGWFVTDYAGTRTVWHYGYWTAISSLIVKVPDRGLTFVVFANTDALSAGTFLGSGRLETSPWARAFLDMYVADKR